MIYIRRNAVLKTLLSLVVVLVVVKIQTSTFFTTLDFLPSPSTFYPHPRLFTLTLDFLPSPSTLDPRHSTLDKNLNSNISYVNRSPIRYGFRVGRKVIRYNVNIALKVKRTYKQIPLSISSNFFSFMLYGRK